ncbi:lysophospholipid acyltransferase family protein [Nocardia brevicatena]|uniref:lysophospholipid acyltransferase family protein n=1 Tax=Nocardia brevicatena TaxID=37327 RepID=UPI0002D845C3|nr:lysophospholipid acyltransferase family protein [Nocardia brevicatena]
MVFRPKTIERVASAAAPGEGVVALPAVEHAAETVPVSPMHAWMPLSPCASGCVRHTGEAGVLRAAGRVVAVVAVLVTYPLVHLLTPAGLRSGVQRRFARFLLRGCGIRLRVVDLRVSANDDEAGDRAEPRARSRAPRYAEPGTGVLVVAGHIGWTDILALAAVQPLGFVARADLIDWPLLGGLARLMRVVPIDRERLRRLPDVVDQVSKRLAAGERIGVFPEGTTWCGRAYGRLRPALFQAAVDTATPVQPVRLRYLDRSGNDSTVPGFVGDDTLLASARRVLRSRGVTAELVLAPLEQPGTDRRELALRCERAVRATDLTDAEHAVLAEANRHVNESARTA